MKQRIWTALIGLIIFLLPLALGGPFFIALVTAMVIVGCMELLRMNDLSIFSLPGLVGVLLSLFLLIAGPQSALLSSEIGFLLLLVCCWLLLIVPVLSGNRYDFGTVAFVVFAAIYVGLGLHYFLSARLNEGFAFVLFVLIAIWATDTGAYLFGRKFGKRPLLPAISPKKTVEGALGGFVLALVASLTFALFYPPFASISMNVIAVMVISVAGQCGDLVESAIKRHYNVKDSGHILPGHGGILDRFDSLIFVFPVLYIVMILAG